jgi:hypothetical protein
MRSFPRNHLYRTSELIVNGPGNGAVFIRVLPNPFHLIRREAVSFANLKTFVPYSPFGRSPSASSGPPIERREWEK